MYCGISLATATWELPALIKDPNNLMLACGHPSSCRFWRSALPTYADYAASMRKPIRRDGDRKSKIVDALKSEDVTANPPCRPRSRLRPA
jgi:hypothetical protein